MSLYLGDFPEDATVHHIWSTNDAAGASITRAVNGTVSVYKDNGVTQSVAGVTDTEDFDGLTGIHALTIDTSADAFYAKGANYTVVLSAATIDGQTVNAVLAHFSIENRSSSLKKLAELPVAQPPKNPTPDEAAMFLYMAERDESDQTETLKQIKNDAGTPIAKATVSDNGTITTRQKYISG